MSLFKRLVAGGDHHKSRLHDEKGNLIPFARAARHLLPAVASGIARKCFGHRPELPWISYSAIRLLRSHLGPQSRVLEFGSGMSTLWYARQAGQVCSVEDNAQWYEIVKARLDRRGATNVEYTLAPTDEAYVSYKSDDEAGFDLVMVDGKLRAQCIVNSAPLVRPGGILYLDNSDKHSSPDAGDLRDAEAHLREYAKSRGATVISITDFAPTQLFVQEGTYVRL